MTKIGFTGTRRGMTPAQFERVVFALRHFRPSEFHHGDCDGADTEVHHLVEGRGVPIVVHPPKDDTHRAFCMPHDGAPNIRIEVPKPYLQRNKDIVDATEVLVAAPAGMKEVRRSGTWSTIRYARRVGKRSIVVFPDGSITIWEVE